MSTIVAPTVRALPTPHDPPTGPVTVATPSCCCCCCCCLNSIGAAVGFSIGATTETAHSHGRPSLGPTLLAVGAAPLAIVAVVVLRAVAELVLGEGNVGDPVGQLIGATAFGVYVGAFVVAFRWAGGGWGRAIGVPLIALLVVVPAVAFEALAAMFTVLLIELLVPGAVLLGIHLGRKATEVPDAAPGAPWPVPHGAWAPPPVDPPGAAPAELPRPDPPARPGRPVDAEVPGLPQLPVAEPEPGDAPDPADGPR